VGRERQGEGNRAARRLSGQPPAACFAAQRGLTGSARGEEGGISQESAVVTLGESLLFASKPTTREDRPNHERIVTHGGRLIRRKTRLPDSLSVQQFSCPVERRRGPGLLTSPRPALPGIRTMPAPAYGTAPGPGGNRVTQEKAIPSAGLGRRPRGGPRAESGVAGVHQESWKMLHVSRSKYSICLSDWLGRACRPIGLQPLPCYLRPASQSATSCC
jgi:hypothetical protein